MKIVYCLIDSSQVGGMERSICCKANYLADIVGYDVTIITTDRKTKKNFYKFSDKIKFIDLGINYGELDSLSLFSRLFRQMKKRKLHKEKLAQNLFEIKPDISISTCTHEVTFLHQIKDGSKKIAESHFNKEYKKIQFSRKSIFSLKRKFALLAERKRQKHIPKYDTFVVLTKEDKQQWDIKTPVVVIPNPLSFYPTEKSNNESKNAISIGRLTYEKGYPLLIEAWIKVASKHPDWKLSIYGEGEDKDSLQRLIIRKKLEHSITIYPPTRNVDKKLLESSLYIMSSLYEGFGLVLTEAMTCGVPCISFDCPCGPAEIITHGEDGLLIENKNVDLLADAIMFLIEDKALRKEMSENAKENIKRFLPEKIMPRWISLFEELTGLSDY